MKDEIVFKIYLEILAWQTELEKNNENINIHQSHRYLLAERIYAKFLKQNTEGGV